MSDKNKKITDYIEKDIVPGEDTMWDRISVSIVAFFFIGFVFYCWFKPATDVSDVERRKLTQKPEMSVENVMSGDYMENFENYAIDQIPFRQQFRSLKAIYSTYVMGQLDNNGLVISDGYIIDMEYTLDENSLDYASQRFNHIYNKYLADVDAHVYLSIIPDKNYYDTSDNALSYDYEYMVEKMCGDMEYAEYIDVFGELSLADYYKTDTHWKQESIVPVAEKIAQAMGANIETEYEHIKLEDKFYGVYYGQMALPLEGDELYYLTNDTIEACQVYDYENSRDISMYDMEAVSSADPYEMYLYGPLSLISITNPKASTDKELIIFRDSFGSSIAPLLATGYSKVTLVDIRYISPEYLGQFLEFDNQDVLFLYNAAVLNNSQTIK